MSHDDAAAPDSLVALIPVSWTPDQITLLTEVHPDIWAEPLALTPPTVDGPGLLTLGDDGPEVTLHVDEAIPELVQMSATARQPYTSTELVRLEAHSAIWRLTLPDISGDPIALCHGFARLVATAQEAGAPGAFFPLCVQLHSPRLIKHLAVDFSQPPALINLLVSAWNDDDWMVTRGLTVMGFPELETPIEQGLNDAYFRLMDVAAGILVQGDPYPSGARLQLGPHLYTVEPGPRGPDDSLVPVCGSFGRLSIIRAD